MINNFGVFEAFYEFLFSLNRYVIAYVEPNGLVDKDGRFKVGDELINVNGNSLRGLSMEAARNVLRQLSGHVDIIVARQPQEANQSANPGEFKHINNFLII